MKAGRIIGKVWATKRLDALSVGALMEVRLEDGGGKAKGEVLIAFDPLGCGAGERVLITAGSVARGWFGGDSVVDALIIGSLDEEAPR